MDTYNQHTKKAFFKAKYSTKDRKKKIQMVTNSTRKRPLSRPKILLKNQSKSIKIAYIKATK
jgi:hypothetical protein